MYAKKYLKYKKKYLELKKKTLVIGGSSEKPTDMSDIDDSLYTGGIEKILYSITDNSKGLKVSKKVAMMSNQIKLLIGEPKFIDYDKLDLDDFIEEYFKYESNPEEVKEEEIKNFLEESDENKVKEYLINKINDNTKYISLPSITYEQLFQVMKWCKNNVDKQTPTLEEISIVKLGNLLNGAIILNVEKLISVINLKIAELWRVTFYSNNDQEKKNFINVIIEPLSKSFRSYLIKIMKLYFHKSKLTSAIDLINCDCNKNRFNDLLLLNPGFRPSSDKVWINNNTELNNRVKDWCDGKNRELTGPISQWDTSGITDMSRLFEDQENFNEDISKWDVSNVKDMSRIFLNAHAFNQPLNSWNVSKVTDMSLMFCGAYAFNQSLNSWDVSNVTNMNCMFYEARVFNHPLYNWNVSKVTNMRGMFYKARAFNQSLNNWNVSKVTNMRGMFYEANVEKNKTPKAIPKQKKFWRNEKINLI